MGDLNLVTYGNIVLKQFYGPPNYGETPAIDSIETFYVLILHGPMTIKHGSETVTVEEIQLTSNNNIKNINANQKYYITGRASFWQTGHHHTPIIISVDRISANL
jgi:hypothetical protein